MYNALTDVHALLRPFITGKGLGYVNDHQSNDFHLDGGFSRTLHPKCHIELYIPLTLWGITQHTLNPALDRNMVEGFWRTGQQYQEKMFSTSFSSPRQSSDQFRLNVTVHEI